MPRSHILPYTKRRNILAVAAVMLGFVLAFSGLFAGYLYSLTRQFEEENCTRLDEVSNFITAHMTTVVTQTQEALQVVAGAVGALDSREKRLDYLRCVAERYGFVSIGYAGSDGLLYSTSADASGKDPCKAQENIQEGTPEGTPENILLDGTPEDIHEKPYFLRARSGTPTASNLERRILSTRAVSGIMLAVPLQLPNDAGALVAMLSVRNLGTALQLETFGGEGATYIIDRSGAVVMRTRSLDINNLLTLWRTYEFDERQSYQQVREQIALGNEGIATFTNRGGVRQYAYYHPLPFNGWMVVNVVAEQAAFGQTLALTRDLAVLAGGMVLLFMGLLLWNMRAQRLRMESQSAAEAKSAFLANMSHEIRTPMNAIVGISEIMLRDNLSSRHHEQLLSIRNSGKGLLSIINDILDISKIESGGFAVVDESYELESLLYDLTIISVIRIGEKPVHFLVDVAPSVPRVLVGDMGRVKQILLNIIGNAVKFTKEGSIRVRVGAEREADMWRLTVEVADTGMGIRQKDLEKLFVRYAQVDTRRNRNVEGTGLGLTISQKLCELMGGEISVTSEYGKGSTFTIIVMQGVDIDDAAPLVTSVSSDVSLLVCTPAPELCGFATACLEQLGVRFELCTTSADFVQHLRGGEYTHVLASRAVLRTVPLDIIPADKVQPVRHIELLPQQEHARIESCGTSVYLPLLTTQLSCALNEGEAVRRLRRHAGIDRDAIEPMPFVSVLIVDDNELNIQVAEGLLAPYGMRLRHACSGPEAIELVQAQHFDLVLMDHMMPEMDGVEALECIRKLPDNRLRTLPVVALTANTTSEARQMFLENGFNDFLAKPIETTRLNAVLMKWLKELNVLRAAIQPRHTDNAANTSESVTPETATPENATPDPVVETVQTVAVENRSFAVVEADAHAVSDVDTVSEVDFSAGQARLPMPGLYSKILQVYVRSTSEKLDMLPEWMDADPGRVVIEVHGLKSASASIGAQRFSDRARDLEQMGTSGDFAALRAGLPEFVTHGRAVVEEVQAYVQRVSAG